MYIGHEKTIHPNPESISQQKRGVVDKRPANQITCIRPCGHSQALRLPTAIISALNHIGFPFVKTPPPPSKLPPLPLIPPPPPTKPLSRGAGDRSGGPLPSLASVSLAWSKSLGRSGPASPLSNCARFADVIVRKGRGYGLKKMGSAVLHMPRNHPPHRTPHA